MAKPIWLLPAIFIQMITRFVRLLNKQYNIYNDDPLVNSLK